MFTDHLRCWREDLPVHKIEGYNPLSDCSFELNRAYFTQVQFLQEVVFYPSLNFRPI